MSHQIDASAFIQIATPNAGRRKFGKKLRVMLPGATVDETTAKIAERYKRRCGSMGLAHDAVYAFAASKKFKPSTK